MPKRPGSSLFTALRGFGDFLPAVADFLDRLFYSFRGRLRFSGCIADFIVLTTSYLCSVLRPATFCFFLRCHGSTSTFESPSDELFGCPCIKQAAGGHPHHPRASP